jgi:L-lysine exporter family protein LysE/ArgO
MPKVYLEGLLLQASLIFALGPQNLFVLESGLKKQYPLTVSLVCFFCDFFLIMCGVAGAASFFTLHPNLKIIFGGLSVCFLIVHGFQKIKNSDSDQSFRKISSQKECLKAAIMSSIIFSMINPHAYLDGIILIGGYSARYDDLLQRVSLGLGAASCSLLWFLLLSLGSSFMVPILERNNRINLVMSISGVTLIFLSIKLGFEVFGWIREIYPHWPIY